MEGCKKKLGLTAYSCRCSRSRGVDYDEDGAMMNKIMMIILPTRAVVTMTVTCRTFCPLHTPATEHACTFDYHGAATNCTALYCTALY